MDLKSVSLNENRQNRLPTSIYLEIRENTKLQQQIRRCQGFGLGRGAWPLRDMKEIWGVMELFYIMIVVIM